MENLDFENIMALLRQMLAEEHSQTAINLWFGDLKLVSLDISEAVFVSPTDLKKKILIQRFSVEMADKLNEILGFEPAVIIHSSEHGEVDLSKPNLETFEKVGTGEIPKAQIPKEVVIPENFRPEYTFDNFIVGVSNKMASSAALAVANQNYDLQDTKLYNPLFIYGPSGVGKTHLLYAIVNKIANNHPDKKIIYIKGEEFANQLYDAIQKKNSQQFRDKYRNADILLIDDIHFVAGKTSTQEELFNTFNAIYEANKQIILTSDRPPHEIRTLEDRLRTRFMSGLIVDIQLPDFDLRCAILQQKSTYNSLYISPEVIKFLAENVTSSIRQLEGVIKKLGAIQLLEGGDLTLDRVKASVKEFVPTKDSDTKKMDDIIIAVSKKFGVTREDILSTKRNKEIAVPRHIIVYVARSCTNFSQSQIGKCINRDRTTVISSESYVKEEMAKNPTFALEVNDIIREIGSN
ncbi:MAG: chromosomal replication initiator protein DnaA [Clostridia bacterium]|nr:chromosomal replication initiator protein DnaA [Clostridia bacterium]